MNAFDFNSPAELFASTSRRSNRHRGPIAYQRFLTAAEAIRFSVEELPPAPIGGTIMEVDGERFDAVQILQLYHRQDYPLARRTRP